MPQAVRNASRFLPLAPVVTLLRGLWFGESLGDHLEKAAVLAGVLVEGTTIAAWKLRWEQGSVVAVLLDDVWNLPPQATVHLLTTSSYQNSGGNPEPLGNRTRVQRATWRGQRHGSVGRLVVQHGENEQPV
jgi:hypothetical protein